MEKKQICMENKTMNQGEAMALKKVSTKELIWFMVGNFVLFFVISILVSTVLALFLAGGSETVLPPEFQAVLFLFVNNFCVLLFVFYRFTTGKRRFGESIYLSGEKNLRLFGYTGALLFNLFGIVALYSFLWQAISFLLPSISTSLQTYNHAISTLFQSPHPIAVFLAVVSVTLFAAVLEELLFRGLTQKPLSYILGERKAILLASLLFGIFHLNLFQGGYAFLLGIFLGFVYSRTQNILYSIFLHFAFNGLSVFLALTFNSTVVTVFYFVCIFSLLYFVFVYRKFNEYAHKKFPFLFEGK